MTREKRDAFSAIIVGALFVLIGVAAGQPTYELPPSVAVFSDVLSVPATGATTAATRIEVKDWYLVGTTKVFQLPAQGFYVVHLRSGNVVTNIAGKPEKRRVGDFWTVDAGVAMTVTFAPHGEAAELQTIAVSPSH